MRCRAVIGFAIGLCSLAVCFWRSNNRADSDVLPATELAPGVALGKARSAPLFVSPLVGPSESGRDPHRLSNTQRSPDELVHCPAAILLENAIWDTRAPLELAIPNELRAQGEPGAYLVQCAGRMDDGFRHALTEAGAAFVSYIPNNACLVRGSAQQMRALALATQLRATLPYEPYYKLKGSALTLALKQLAGANPSAGMSAPARVSLNVVLFPDALSQAFPRLRTLGLQVLEESPSPFGPVLAVACSATAIPALAALPDVQEIELAHPRVPAVDLSRARLGIATDTTSVSKYLGLTGDGVLVNVNDSGVDASHPDLVGRVLAGDGKAATDVDGHGTHVAGVIAGSGVSSLSVSNVPGSWMPPVSAQFRGVAPAAMILAETFDPANAWPGMEGPLFQSAAATNATISNNSWVYADDDQYDVAAAVCDAAVRDSLPGLPGPQPLVCVFAAGNSGDGSDNGYGGRSASIQSPATAKNVISVGALEQPRFITNQTWTCTNATGCRTNSPWLGSTDSGSRVAAFSSRGNVAPGLEGRYGRFKPEIVAPGVFVLSARSTEWDLAAAYSPTNQPLYGPPDENYFEVLSNLNASAGPLYRFESGTSVAAAEVSGTLALMQEFFRVRLGAVGSPALMKALLINGARPIGPYDFAVRAVTNFQGWGVVQLPNSIPLFLTNRGGTCSSFFLDQDPARSLATGQSCTELVWIKPGARALPLRVTAAWTDPAANPLAAVKLVNDLDVIVTNLDTGAVFFGNDFAPGSSFTSTWDPGSSPASDSINNVENVFLAPPLSAHYSVTVVAKSVNVNAVTGQVGTAQDFALVISSGDGQVPDALTVGEPGAGSVAPAAQVTVLTNQFEPDALDFGCVLYQQRIGAGSPLQAVGTIPWPGGPFGQISIGTLNQWHFYMINNETAFTNAVFLTFSSPPLGLDGTGLLEGGTSLFAPGEGDIDLYVSQDSNLTNLDAAALAAADKSLGRGGTETIVYSNAIPGFYYVGVKCESSAGAQYSLMAAFSDTPYSANDAAGNTILRGIPSSAGIPGQDSTSIMCVAPDPIFVRRVVVTNTIIQPAMGDLTSVLSCGTSSAALLNHPAGQADGVIVFDDSGEGDIPGARACDGPGDLLEFAGPQSAGQWQLSLTSTNQPGTSEGLWLSLQPETDTSGNFLSVVLPAACRRDLMTVAPVATNLTVAFTLVSGAGPVSIQVYPLGFSPSVAPVAVLDETTPNNALVIDNTSVPPLRAGVYAVRVCNAGRDTAAVRVASSQINDLRPPRLFQFTSEDPVPIQDDAVSSSTIDIQNDEQVAAVNVGVRIDHPRLSDLVLRLISPSGTRVLLQENRGGLSAEGMGIETMITNMITVATNGGSEAVTNILETGSRSGTVTIDYDFFSLPDRMTVYYANTLLLDTGMVSNGGHTNLSYGPGSSTFVTIVMNQDGNSDTNTVWYYNATSTHIGPFYVNFTENTNFASVPIKFAVPPLTNANYFAPGSNPSSGIFYFPEESLSRFAGESAAGLWKLEIEDTRAGGTNGSSALLSWRLGMFFQASRPVPVALSPGVAFTNSLGQGQIQCFTLDPPAWVNFASNQLLFASVPVNLIFNPSVPPTGTNASDALLLGNTRSGTAVLQTNGSPPLVPGSRYYLAIQNTNKSAVTFALQVAFDLGAVATLESGFSYSTNSMGVGLDYYRFVVSSNAVRAQFEVNAPTADVTLFARRGLPLPAANRFDYASANPGTNDELIVVYDYSAPVPLTAGEWYLGVAATLGQPVAYSVLATEFSAYGTNLVISAGLTNQSFSLVWDSLPGVHYFVQGKAALTDPGWINVSPGLTAIGPHTIYSVDLPCPFQFFRVGEGLVLSFPPPEISTTRTSQDQLLLRWTAPPGMWFVVEWTPALDPASWSAFSNTVYSMTGAYEFLDDCSESGPPTQTRYYRVRVLP